jgi:hypothetical protein
MSNEFQIGKEFMQLKFEVAELKESINKIIEHISKSDTDEDTSR